MTLTQLNYIITIAETKSINKAAGQLYVSQPSLTSAVRELEKELGITLFHRSGRGVTLTNDGAEFLPGLPGGARPVVWAVVEAVDGRLSGLVETERDFAEYFLLLYAGFAGRLQQGGRRRADPSGLSVQGGLYGGREDPET